MGNWGMSGKQKHRGPHPEDEKLFSDSQVPLLRLAVSDLSWLLTRGYSDASALKLVGDRYKLTERQRKVVMRGACTDAQKEDRQAKEVKIGGISGKEIWIDGFNIIISLETAASGGFLFLGRDGRLRDNSSVHGSYRQVSETVACIQWVGEWLQNEGAQSVKWLLDQPVSNSGRLLSIMYAMAEEKGWPWSVELVPSPDAVLKKVNGIVATSDAVILDHSQVWIDIPKAICGAKLPHARIIELEMPTI